MCFTGIGIVCIIICTILMFCQWKYLIRFLIISAPFQGVAIVNANGFGLSLFMFTEMCVIAKSIFQNIYGIKASSFILTKKQVLPLTVFFVWSILVTFVFGNIFDIEYTSFGGKTSAFNKLIIIIVHFTCFCVIHTKVKINDFNFIKNSVYIQLIIVLTLGYYGVFAHKYGISLTWLMKFIDNNEGYVTINWQMNRLHVPFLEPSMCAGYIVPIFWGMVAINSRESKKLALITLPAIILNMSTTGIVTFAAGFLLFLVLRNNKTYWKYTALIILTLSIALCNENIRVRFLDMTVNKADSVSGIDRSSADIEALKTCFKSWGIGIGLVGSRASSLITTLLVSTGFIGCFSYITFCIRCISWKNIKSYGEVPGYSTALLLTLVAQAVSIPDINYPIYWMFIYVLDITKKNNQRLNLLTYDK